MYLFDAVIATQLAARPEATRLANPLPANGSPARRLIGIIVAIAAIAGALDISTSRAGPSRETAAAVPGR